MLTKNQKREIIYNIGQNVSCIVGYSLNNIDVSKLETIRHQLCMYSEFELDNILELAEKMSYELLTILRKRHTKIFEKLQKRFINDWKNKYEY